MTGVNVGRKLDPLLPKAYFQTRASYAFVERVMDISHNRTNIDSEVGYQLNERVGFSALVSFQKNHGGLKWIPDFGAYSSEEWHVHGQLFKNDVLDVGGGASFRLNQSTTIWGNILRTTWSRNSHALNRGLILGMNRTFKTWRAQPLPNPAVR